MITSGFLKKGGLIIIAAVAAVATEAQAEPKKDISDPVLQEIIASYESRMPRFVKKHGNDVFVADATMNRGAFLMALYEFEHSQKIPQKNFATRQELDDMKSRLALIEKNPALVPGRQPEKPAAPSNAIAFLNELQPNMPVLLDNTLNDSKVFRELREEVRSRGGTAAGAAIANTAAQSQRDTIALLQRIERLEKAQAVTAIKPVTAPSRIESRDWESLMLRVESLEQRQQRNSVAEVTQKDIRRIEDRIDDVSFMADVSGPSGEGRPSSFLTKVGVGVGMVAAFMVAR